MKFYLIVGIIWIVLTLVATSYGNTRKRDDKELEEMFKKHLKKLGRSKQTDCGGRRPWNWMKGDTLAEMVAQESNRDVQEVRALLYRLCGEPGPFQMRRAGDPSTARLCCAPANLLNPHYQVSLRVKK